MSEVWVRSRAKRAQRRYDHARALQRDGRLSEATALYRRALELAPERAAWHFELGVLLQEAGEWAAAAQAFAAATTRAPQRAEWHARLGQCLVRAREYGAGAEAWSAAVALAPERAAWQRQLAKALRLAGDRDTAIAVYRRAVELAPERAVWHYELGWALEEVDDRSAARAAYAEGLRADPDAKPVHAAMLASTPWRFPRRRGFVDFVAEHIDEIRERADAGEEPLPDAKIYVYWAQGIAEAPTVVQRCYRELQRWHAPEDIVLLDERVWEQLAIPSWTRERVKHRLAHAAGVLRLELLSRHGGVWLDATCLVRRPVLPLVPELAPTGFFAFEREPNFPSTWMLISTPGNYLTAMWREAVHVYWKYMDRLLDYFLLGSLFEALCWIDPPFRRQWEATLRLGADEPHVFGRARFEPYEPVRYAQLLNSSFVQKLTYKERDARGSMTPGSMMARFIDYGTPEPAP